MIRLILAFAFALLLTESGAVPAPEVERLNRDALTLTFNEDFKRPPSFYDPVSMRDGRWKTNFAFGIQDPASPQAWKTRTLRPNNELEYYAAPGDRPTAYLWQPGSLTLVARALPDPRHAQLPYESGLITTERSFKQRYGYFEARVTMPIGKGLWPAFWLLPPFRPDAKVQSQQEIDIFENVGRDGELYLTVHHDEGGTKVADPGKVAIDTVARPHDYGVLVTPTEISWYVDDMLVRRVANKDFHQPAYMLLNLAVGGDWPGAPDDTTRFPAKMKVEWVRAYALKSQTGRVDGAQ